MIRVRILSSLPFLCAFLLCTACALDSGLAGVWGGDCATPVLESVVSVSEAELVAVFSAPVTVTGALLYPRSGDDVGLESAVHDINERELAVNGSSVRWQAGESASEISFILEEPPSVGKPSVLSATVEDDRGNSLSFAWPFTGYNARPARLRINEIRTAYSKPKVEYVEFLVLESGNLSGVEITNARNEDDPTYVFPAAEAAAGEYVVYHLRSVEDGLVDETGATDESAGIDARPGARDFWDTLTSSPLKKTNVILVRERAGGPIMDALLCAESSVPTWPTDALSRAAREACASGAWGPGPDPADAAVSDNTTATRTLGRNPSSEDSGTAGDWSVCKTGKASPGAVNVAVAEVPGLSRR
jgi:hypothetical protein